MQFIEVFQATFKANQNSIQNLATKVGKLAWQLVERSSMAMREETSLDDKAYKESLEQEHDSRSMGNGKEEKDYEGPQNSVWQVLIGRCSTRKSSPS